MKLVAKCVGVLLVLAPGVLLANSVQKEMNREKIGHVLREKMLSLGSHETRQVMVYMSKKPSFRAAAAAQTRVGKLQSVYNETRALASDSQTSIVKYLKNSGYNFRQFYIANMVLVTDADQALIRALSLRSDVDRILDDAKFSIQRPVAPSEPVVPEEIEEVGPNLKAAKADKVWGEYGIRGENIVVAGQDTGIDWKHPALQPHYRGLSDAGVDHSYSWHDAIREPITGAGANRCGYNLTEPCDDNDHGTHTLGSVVGDDQKGTIVGMAPGAKWIGCRNMDAGTGRPSTYIDCFEFFLAPYPQKGNPATDGKPELAPHVINNSWGCPGDEQCEGNEFVEVLTALRAAGIMVVVSAGNDGSDCETISAGPAHHSDLILSVGAYSHGSGSIAGFSSRGPSTFDGKIGPHVTAPGVNIRSSVPGGGYKGLGWSGTSMSGPHVVGQVALLWSAVPSLIGNIDATISKYLIFIMLFLFRLFFMARSVLLKSS